MEAVLRDRKYDWLARTFVDGRMIQSRVFPKGLAEKNDSLAHMTFEEAGMEYDGLLKFVTLVSLSPTTVCRC